MAWRPESRRTARFPFVEGPRPRHPSHSQLSSIALQSTQSYSLDKTRATLVAGNGQVAVGCADKQGRKDSSTQYEGYSRKYARALHLLRVSRMPRRCPGLTPRLTITRVADGCCNSSLYA